jgi:mannose-6-phosphate isomerase-like protein (cupin superfamily)
MDAIPENQKDKVVLDEKNIPFVNVNWGRTKELVGRYCAAHSEHILMKITEYSPGFVHEKHAHPEQEEIIFVLSGNGFSETGSGIASLYPGCVSMIPAGVPHATHNPNSEPLRVIIVKAPPDKDTVA